jgi:hypothetical protein
VKRVLGIVLLGLGTALAMFAAGLRFYATPIAANIPYNLDNSLSVAEASDGDYINTTNGQDVKATLRSSTWVVPQPVITKDKMTGDLAGKAVVWDVYSQIEDTSTGTVVTSSKEEIALDRKSGAAATWSGAYIDSGTGPQNNPYKGHAYKLPFNAEKKSYPFWDGQLNRTNDINFVAEETVSGLDAYKYTQSIPAEKVPFDANNLNLLRAVFGGGSGDVYYSVNRTIWVEPVTGQFLNVKQTVLLEFQGGNGTKKTLLAGDFEYNQATKDSSAASIKKNRSQLMLVSLYLPAGGGGGGLLLIIVGVVLIAIGRTKQSTSPDAPATETPAPASA